MTDTITTVALIVLTLLSLAAWAVAMNRARRVAKGGEAGEGEKLQDLLMLATIVLGGGAYIFRVIKHRWQPLEAHVDGLLLIGVLLAVTVFFLVRRARIRGLSLFALPLLALIFLWAVCASLWTFQLFAKIDSIWQSLHRISVYGGMLFFAIASVAGVMYLYVQRKLRVSHDPTATKPFASLESIESLIVRTSAFGFALLSLGLITGLIVVTGGPTRLGTGWWYSPKVILTCIVWVIYALVMNVKHTTHFRGARAAWLSIAGLVLLIATFGVATTLPPLPEVKVQPPTSTSSLLQTPSLEGQRPCESVLPRPSAPWPLALGPWPSLPPEPPCAS
ncbi:MAG: cytochrome c biogenesis protein CcsA [Phycisphaeraceae bacterium]